MEKVKKWSRSHETAAKERSPRVAGKEVQRKQEQQGGGGEDVVAKREEVQTVH